MAESHKSIDLRNDTLIFAHVIFRHGQRNIVEPLPNGEYEDEVHWPGGFGQLTKEGKRQLFFFGQYLRRRYDKLIGKKYSPNEIYVRSTDFDRTIMSAQVCLAGMYPPTAEEIWKDDLLWQPIPVHIVPRLMDSHGAEGCRAYTSALEKHIEQCPEEQKVFSEHADLIDFWSQKAGVELTSTASIFCLHDTLTIHKKTNKRLPEWAEKAIEPNGVMANIAKEFLKLPSATPTLAKLRSGFMIKEILERFKQKIERKLFPNRSLWLYAAHDFVLNALELFEPHLPPYAASLHFELYETSQGEHYFQIVYRKSDEEQPKLMNLPGCGERISLDRFYELYEKIIPGDYDTECRV